MRQSKWLVRDWPKIIIIIIVVSIVVVFVTVFMILHLRSKTIKAKGFTVHDY